MRFPQTILVDTTGERGYASKLVAGLSLETDALDKETGEVKRISQAWRITVAKCGDLKSREQEKRYHAMIGDIAEQCKHLNQNFDAETWKRLLVDQFKRETLKEPECCARYWARHQLNIMPSLDGSALVVLGEQTRRFPPRVAAAFIEWLFSYGSEREVAWSDPTEPPIDAYSGLREGYDKQRTKGNDEKHRLV